jgi:hypothetical protein
VWLYLEKETSVSSNRLLPLACDVSRPKRADGTSRSSRSHEAPEGRNHGTQRQDLLFDACR